MSANQNEPLRFVAKPSGPPGIPPKGWSSPAIRFWRTHLKRPFPPVVEDGYRKEKKWSPMLKGMDPIEIHGVSIRRWTAEVLEFEASLLNGFSPGDPANDEMSEFIKYIKENEVDWFLVGKEDLEAALATAEEPSGVGVFLKHYFPTIRRRCNADLLTKITEEIFNDRDVD